MATKMVYQSVGGGNNNIHATVGSWMQLALNEAGDPVGGDKIFMGSRTVQVTGTFGLLGSVVIEGSNDGINYFPLSAQISGLPLVFTAPGLKQVLEVVRYIRPRVTAGDGNTSLAVALFMRS